MNEVVKTMKKGFAANLKEAIRKNADFRKGAVYGKIRASSS
jgi:hypothetical protein